ncbi:MULTISPECIES: hypothetical protein [Bradyrhizobium]|uniref:Uncharacterized protein n=1 Tax=Bradyrhizobium arachidis TaxID=858423 RepID=A0AAE7TKR8_9BRAD|nr:MULTISPECIES: hypothetical protein [Bradyrhizobium]QOG17562.1 hypothetical protein FOM02_09630 [Bradyrhizobium sp. SEMIA]QOZ71381.1 hypothetical protein WN72_37675 [Bradyrhizobium arachidis]UFW47693.1 hypothetical protein BaraCB756_36380 [Bradyrhizobium arachidis]
MACFGALALGAALIATLVILVDPYDSGRFGPFAIRGVADRNPWTANVSRARDTQFDSAILGNSTGQLLEPARLDKATGLRFVQLVAPGADPRGDLAILDFFARHHQTIRALVFSIDQPWCSQAVLPLSKDPFPYWLYEGGTLRQLGHLFTWAALDRSFQRIAIARGARQPVRADGYWNYEELWAPGAKHPTAAEPANAAPFRGKVTDHFPYADMLAAAIGKFPREVAVVLVMPPTFYTIVPVPGTRDAAVHAACREAFRSIVSGRANSNLVDYRVDNALTRDPANFTDLVHYRAAIARRIEQGIAASLRDGQGAKIDF